MCILLYEITLEREIVILFEDGHNCHYVILLVT